MVSAFRAVPGNFGLKNSDFGSANLGFGNWGFGSGSSFPILDSDN